MLITTGDHDDRVVPSHTFKYMAELQYKAGNGKVPGQNPLLLQVKKDQGHSGGASMNSAMQDLAVEMGFMAKILKVKWI